MNSTHPNHKEAQQKGSPVDTVKDLISQKEHERHADGMNKVLEQADAVQRGVSGILENVESADAGMEAARDHISERNREDKRGDLRTGGGQTQTTYDDQQSQQIRSNLRRRAQPSPNIMIARVRHAIKAQIKEEQKAVKKLEKNLTAGTAQEYSVKIAKIRRLQETLSLLVNTTVEKIKDLYHRYFGSDGRPKSLDEV